MKCTELLNQDHAILRRGLDILDGMVRKLEDGQRIETADARAILKFLRIFRDGFPQTMEETVAAMEEALNSKRARAFARSSRQLILLLRSHLDKEQGEVVAAEFTKSETQSEIYANFTRLERKYAPNRHGTPIELHA